jgi:hypothetical protein
MRADNSRHIIAAAHRRREYTRAKAVQALRNLNANGQPITFQAIADKAGVSRSWLYAQPDLRAEIEQHRAVNRKSTAIPLPARQRASDVSLLRRLEAAHARIQGLTAENRQLRQHLELALGEQRTATRTTGRGPRTRIPNQ